jgi:hypothetical protein
MDDRGTSNSIAEEAEKDFDNPPFFLFSLVRCVSAESDSGIGWIELLRVVKVV